jgi:hypothetical protein
MVTPKRKTVDIIMVVITLFSIIVAFSIPRISQDVAYHEFADEREMLSVPNFLNVITNLPFVLIGVVGLFRLLRARGGEISWSTVTLFIGVTAIGLGSAWYHYDPTNATLVWDRLPMTIVFVSYLSIIVEQHVNKKLGTRMLVPALIIGVFSVWYWYYTEQQGAGDLRLYGWVQFFPMLCIPLIVFLYPASSNIRLGIISVILVYALAKVVEANDHAILNSSGVISGHSLKHLFASIAVLLILLTQRDQKAELNARSLREEKMDLGGNGK